MQAFPFQVIIIVFAFGLCVGSFLNVCIYRIPESKSIVTPGSMCPRCGVKIRFYDNIPLLSYLLLRGRCRNCRASIAVRYPLVELLSGALAVAVLIKFGLTPEAAVTYGFAAVLIVITFIDIDHRIIPDVISLPGIAAFFLAARLVPSVTWLDSLIGILAGGGSLFLVAWFYHLITRKEGMGGGDIKLLAMIGAMIGWKGVLFTIFASSASGTLVGLIVMLIKRQNMKLAVPFGPFLALGAVMYLFYGPQVIAWYLQSGAM
ncbi:MAG: peptidase A24 [Deltaproteobacteria bacterium SG8_13]|nr:MAG: peptidase A24 [Deltaproteobacteria bacterium SG8_13]